MGLVVTFGVGTDTHYKSDYRYVTCEYGFTEEILDYNYISLLKLRCIHHLYSLHISCDNTDGEFFKMGPF